MPEQHRKAFRNVRMQAVVHRRHFLSSAGIAVSRPGRSQSRAVRFEQLEHLHVDLFFLENHESAWLDGLDRSGSADIDPTTRVPFERSLPG